MLINILLGVLIFGYAGWTLFRFVQKSKKGKCATCELKSVCNTPCDSEKTDMHRNNYTMDER
ncbi:FeoB-associated Cys-rich membrane protein [Cerasibacillus terrae]|uniref:FeoB-associated Cys-rich membrane protein n=1 Tax=Cerasibacillus terrae TaxID=2498845 RepID=A0A5C8NV84_9BACI|nr:FeoB-associated Cys-rich membrane protein [Cerasibacillus terrae]TXL65117.1 FeoB-associated Cys-rich membrane protein [Cerasibacillus terrae]